MKEFHFQKYLFQLLFCQALTPSWKRKVSKYFVHICFVVNIRLTSLPLKKSNAQRPAQCAHVTAAPETAGMGLGGILGLIFGLLFGVILLAAAFFTCRLVVVLSFSFSNFFFSYCSHRPRERPKAINSRSSSKRNSGGQFDSQLGLITLTYFLSLAVFPAFDDKTAPLLKQPILRFQKQMRHKSDENECVPQAGLWTKSGSQTNQFVNFRTGLILTF